MISPLRLPYRPSTFSLAAVLHRNPLTLNDQELLLVVHNIPCCSELSTTIAVSTDQPNTDRIQLKFSP